MKQLNFPMDPYATYYYDEYNIHSGLVKALLSLVSDGNNNK